MASSEPGPPRKRPRLLPAAGAGDDPLSALYGRALIGCLCRVPEGQLAALSAALASAEPRRQLLALSCVQLLQQAARRQLQLGSRCERLAGAACEPDSGRLLSLLGGDSPLLSCAAGHCLTLSALLVSPERAQPVIEALVAAVLSSERPLEVSHALNCLQRLIEQQDEEPGPGTGGQPPPGCRAVSVTADPEWLAELKCAITAQLENRWIPVTQRFCRLLARPEHETEALAFLRLWATVLSVRNNLSVAETKSLYSRLEGLLGCLSGAASPHVWRAVLDLYSEVLCYGSTIALQDCVAEEPASLAHALLRQTRAGRLLELVPYERGVRSFAGEGGGEPAGDRPLMQRTVLLLLKALAVTVKETRCDSSSDASRSGGSGSEEQDMVIIERTLREVVRRLDCWVKARLDFHPAAPLSEWAVSLLCDQDDSLVEAMLCLLDLSSGLSGRVRLPADFERAICPHHSFVQFVETTRYDHDLLLDFLLSNETCFLLYLLRYLKWARRGWARLTAVAGGRLDQLMTVLIRLRLSLERLVARDLFPYNVSPLLRLLQHCEELHERNGAERPETAD